MPASIDVTPSQINDSSKKLEQLPPAPPRPSKKRISRKRQSKGNAKNVFSLRLHTEDICFLERIAEYQGKTPRSLAREIIKEYLDRHKES